MLLLGSRNLCVLPVFPQNLQTHPYAMALPSALKQPPPGYTHKCIERFLHSIWRYRSKSSMVHGESALLSVPGAFSLLRMLIQSDTKTGYSWVSFEGCTQVSCWLQLTKSAYVHQVRTPLVCEDWKKENARLIRACKGEIFFQKKKKRIFHQRNLTWLYISSSTSHLFTFQSDI